MPSIVRTASVWLLAVLLAASLAAFFAALSAAQLTTSDTGERVLRRAVAISTDVDAALPRIQQDLRALAVDDQGFGVNVPGFPIEIHVTNQEARTMSATDLRARILDASASSLYDDGTAAWTSSDPKATRAIQRFSATGALNTGLGQVRGTIHTVALVLAVLLGVLTLGLAIALFVAVPWDGRLLALGGAGLLAGLPMLAASVGLRFAFRTAGPDNDPFVTAMFDIGADGMWVPIRNYFTLTIVSLGVMLIGTGLLCWEAGNVRIEPGPAEGA